jgi:methionyl-tRNA formyltransferase
MIRPTDRPHMMACGCLTLAPPLHHHHRHPDAVVPVKQFALRTGLPLHQPPRLKEWAVPRTKDGHAFDIGVVVSFGHFIPPSVLDALPWGAINMHPSLLPRHTYPPPPPIHPSPNQPTSQPASQ